MNSVTDWEGITITAVPEELEAYNVPGVPNYPYLLNTLLVPRDA